MKDQFKYKNYKELKSLFKTRDYEIILANRIADNLKVVLKQSLLFDENDSKASKLCHEYEILKELNHNGIPKVYDFLHDGKTVAFVQEYIDGTNLREQIFMRKMSILEIVNIAIQIAEILDYMHQKGVIHKNINPGNIIITNNGSVKLYDFTISTNLYSETNEMLNVDQIEGSLSYISPEQTGRTAYSVAHTSDFYSFGILLYELLAGKPPFDSVDPLEVIHFHLSRNPIPLSTLLPEIPKAFEQVISKLIRKNPDDRYRSAFGLKVDLELIKNHLTSKKKLLNFHAGTNDNTGQYKQSQKLYGRENEINELLAYYKNLHRLKSMLALVAGYSGVGKSALIRHIKFPIIQNKGTFISGKFDQFKKDLPYFAFIEAFKDFIKNLLSEPEEKINFWRQRITGILGDNAGLITEVIPQLSRIIKTQPTVPKLQPAEQEARFNMVLLDFIYAFSTAENPLVIFLDDLQWADLSSLNLVKRIMENPRADSILILGAYRDNEIEKGHPLLITLKQINVLKEQINIIQIKPLNREITCKITADSFAMNENNAIELGQKVYTKTKGNPFFIHSFLKSLYDKKVVFKDSLGNWVWNQKEIDDLDYTDNVIDLMTEGLIVLPVQTQEVLKYAAVLGNTFNLEDLSDITKKTQATVYNDLRPAIKEGYINSIDKRYKALALNSIKNDYNIEQQFSKKTAQFTFTHDKVQQAAYGLINDSELATVHLKIGRLLLQSREELQLHEGIFELLNHFALSLHLVEDGNEKKRIAELCLIAGRIAKNSNSFSLGVRFLQIGKILLGSNSWIENYELTYNILLELGECEYLNDNPTKAEQYFKEILGYSKTNFEKLKVYYLHSSLYIKIGNTQESLQLGLKAAKLYNIRFPKNKNAIQLVALLALVKYLFLFSTKYKNPDSLFYIEDCKDEEIIALNNFLIDLATSAYQQDKNLMMLVVFTIIKNYIKYGFTDASGWGLSGFSVVVLFALKLQKRGFNLWDLTIKLHQKTKSPLIKWRLSFTVLSFNNPWRIPFREGYDSLLETIKACILNGDQIFTGYTIALYIRSRFFAGENIKKILDSTDDHYALVKNTNSGLDFFQGYYQIMKVLNGQTYNGSWDDNSFSGKETFERLNEEGNKTKLATFHVTRCIFLYFSRDYRAAINESKNSQLYSDNMLGELVGAFHAFYSSLSISACYESLNSKEKKKNLKAFRKHLKDMELWAKGCPENFMQHYYLLAAELNNIENRFDKALHYYEKSIKTAFQNNCTYVVAIANERAAILSYKKQFINQSKLYLNDAWEAYSDWGAILKCQHLENDYPNLLNNKLNKNNNNYEHNPFDPINSSKTSLDLASVLKASQSIASQVKYDDLLKKLMYITIENAGAQKGSLLLYKENQLCIEAVGVSGSENIEILPSVPVGNMNMLPTSILNYCWRTEEVVVVNDALNEGQFTTDAYIQEKKIHSVMCLPITSLGKINGLLYLENSLIKGVFNKNRIELLQMLSGQIGISIENAILYENLEEKVIQRTREIEKTLNELKATQSQLIQAEKMASLGELTAGIAHEIQNPLNFVTNFAELSVDLLTEMNEEMTLKNYTEVQEIASDIKQNLEKINHHGKRASGIIKGMLEHSRTSSRQKELTDINALADEYLRLAYHGLRAKDKSFNADFKTELDESLPKINVIPQDIARVLLNLINNAFYAVDNRAKSIDPLTPKGGIEERGKDYVPTVTISTAFQNPPSGGKGVRIVVKDNGPGIPSSIVDKIFQPFFTTKPTGQGTGLGLSLSYDIVKAHGGELMVEPMTNGQTGTKFIITLPIT